MTFEEIFKLLPSYFNKLKEREASGELYCDQIANFEVNSYYDIEEMRENFDVCHIFSCSDISVVSAEEE